MKELETRHFNLDNVELREQDDNTVSFSGYVVKYNTRSEFLGFYEQVDKRAFDNSIKSDENIFALYNHSYDKVLGSTRNNTLKLSSDDVGLRFELKPKANTSFMNDVTELVRSGELRGMSFGFIVNQDYWETKDGNDFRTLQDVNLKEITLTPIPVYGSSEVSNRSYDAYKQQQQRNKELELLKIEMDLLNTTYSK